MPVKVKCYELKKAKGNQLALVCENIVTYNGEKVLNSPSEVYFFIKDTLKLDEYAEEQMYAIGINNAGSVTSFFKVGQGSVNYSTGNPSGIFKRLLLANCTAFFVVHNHPSNKTEPSQADIQLTKNLKKVGAMLEIPLLDHLVIGEGNYFSFKEKNML